MSKPLSQNQKTFNKVYRHLIRQGEKSVKNGVCVYRGNNGLRCAVGALIPNRLYDPNFERFTAGGICGELNRTLLGLGYDLGFVRELQVIHDGCEPNEWRDELKRFATTYNLTIPKVDVKED